MAEDRAAQRIALFRVDASPTMGGGHIMRCLTLANQLHKRGWRVTFVTGPETTTTVPALTRSKHQVFVLQPEQLRHAHDAVIERFNNSRLIVFDHYGIDAEEEARWRTTARTVVVLDDLADRNHHCDILIDPTLDREPTEYKTRVPAACQILIGPKYALVRPAFAQMRKSSLARRANVSVVRRVIISFGMTDPGNMTADALRWVGETLPDVEIDVVVGPAYCFTTKLKHSLAMFGKRARLFIDPPNMPEILARADLAVGSAGSGSWERCCLGLPTIAVSIAANQDMVLSKLVHAGAAVLLPRDADDEEAAAVLRELACKPGRLQEMMQMSASVCDGAGVSRVARVIDSVAR